MTDAETRLVARLKQDRPASADAAFRIAVLERIVQRRFETRIAAAGVLAALLTAAGWMLGSSLIGVAESLTASGVLPVLGIAAGLVSTTLLLTRVGGPQRM
jgi:phosphate/sulfate permease